MKCQIMWKKDNVGSKDLYLTGVLLLTKYNYYPFPSLLLISVSP